MLKRNWCSLIYSALFCRLAWSKPVKIEMGMRLTQRSKKSVSGLNA